MPKTHNLHWTTNTLPSFTSMRKAAIAKRSRGGCLRISSLQVKMRLLILIQVSLVGGDRQRAGLLTKMKMISFNALALVAVLSSYRTSGNPTSNGVIYAAAPEERGAFYVGGKGVYNYGYNTGDGIAKVEVRNADGSVTGSYRYFDPNGQQIVRSYIADKRGFRVLGNELPISPGTPAVGILNAQTLTGPVEGTQDFGTFQVQNQNVDVPSNSDSVNVPTPFNDALDIYNKGILEQEDLIRKQKESLAELKAQKIRLEQKNKLITVHAPVERKLQTQNGYFTSIVNSLGDDSPYFYASDNIEYDFPAGFAYNSPGVYYSVVYPVGVKGHESPALISAGHTASNKHVHTITAPTREYKPQYNYENYSNRRRSPTIYQRPYIIGHF